MSNLIIYVHKDFIVIRRRELKDSRDKMVWLDIIFKGGWKMTCGYIYREFLLARQAGNNIGDSSH